MDAFRQVQQAMAAHRLGWQDIWIVTVDRREGRVVLITTDGRKFSQALHATGTAARTRLIKQTTNDERRTSGATNDES